MRPIKQCAECGEWRPMEGQVCDDCLRKRRDFHALDALFLGQVADKSPGNKRWKREARKAADRAYAIEALLADVEEKP